MINGDIYSTSEIVFYIYMYKHYILNIMMNCTVYYQKINRNSYSRNMNMMQPIFWEFNL